MCASSLLNSIVSTLTTLALYNLALLLVISSYDVLKIDKKLNLFALRQKIEFGLCKKLENFVITKTLKMPTAFCHTQNPLFLLF